MSYLTSRRLAEFGIRRTLGASRGSLVAMVLRDAWVLVAAGIAIGTPAAIAEGRSIAASLFGVSPTGLGTVAAAAILMFGVAIVATIVPALRAARIEPLVALRQE
jgi:ABC-type antimicrobial peptide transport system permease subunit